MVCFTKRAFNYRFAELELTQYERGCLAQYEPPVQGYLAWRRTLLFPMTVLISLASLLELVLLIVRHRRGTDQNIEQLVGEQIWTNVFCPSEPCDGAGDSLIGVYHAILATDVLLLLVSLLSSVLLIFASRSWAAYMPSSRSLRSAYGAVFIAPFVLLLLLPPANFIDVAQAQEDLCNVSMRELVPRQSWSTVLQRTVCAAPVSNWEETMEATLVDSGRLVNSSTGSCRDADQRVAFAAKAFAGDPDAECRDDSQALRQSLTSGSGAPKFGLFFASCEQAVTMHACAATTQAVANRVLQNCPVSCGICEVPAACVDDDAAFAAVAVANGLVAQGAPTCAEGAALTALDLCNSNNLAQRAAMRGTCPLSCGACSAPCIDNEVAFGLQSAPSGLGSCADVVARDKCASPPALGNVCRLSCGLCSSSGRRRERRSLQLAGAFDGADAALEFDPRSAFRIDGCVDPLILTAIGALEVALSDEVIVGAVAWGRISAALTTLLPAALGLALGASQGSTLAKTLLPASRLPARLAGLIISASLPPTIAVLAIINQALASWFGTLTCVAIVGTLLVWYPARPAREACSGTAELEAIRRPSSAADVVTAVNYRKWAVTVWLALVVVFGVLFLSIATTVSVLTDKIDEFHAAFAQSAQGDSGPLGVLLLPWVHLVLVAIAKTYLAQVFYTDQAVLQMTLMHRSDKSDPVGMREQRARELDAVAQTMNGWSKGHYKGHAKTESREQHGDSETIGDCASSGDAVAA